MTINQKKTNHRGFDEIQNRIKQSLMTIRLYMNKNKRHLAVLGAMLVLSQAIWAEGEAEEVAKSAFHGVFLGGNVGLGGMVTPKTQVPNTDTISSSETIGYGFVYHLYGGYLWRQDKKFQVGFSLGYESYPKNSYSYIIHSAGDVQTSSLDYEAFEFPLIGMLRYQLIENASVSVLAGMSYVLQKNTFSFSDTNSGASSLDNTEQLDAFKPLLGIGAEYRYQKFGLGISYRHRFGDKPAAFSLPGTSVGQKLYQGYNKIPPTNQVFIGINYYFT